MGSCGDATCTSGTAIHSRFCSSSLMSFAPVTMNSVCQMPSPTRGTMPRNNPPTPSTRTMSLITVTMPPTGLPMLPSVCASIRATSNGWFQHAMVPPMTPAPTSCALVSLAFWSPCSATFIR